MYNTGHLKTIYYHQRMLADEVRVLSYQQAIHEVVKPGDTVIDLGAGTGILSLFAAQAGAARVFAIEAGPVSSVTTMLVHNNDVADRVEVIKGFSKQIDLPERVDVLLTEIIGGFGLDEGILSHVVDVRERFLKPGGSIIPHAIKVFVVPIEMPGIYADIERWAEPIFNLDFSKIRPLMVNNLHFIKFSEHNFVGDPALLYDVELQNATEKMVHRNVTIAADRQANIHGIGVWFNAHLAPGISLTNAPPLKTPSWQHGFLPLDRPIAVDAGQKIDIKVGVTASGSQWLWDCKVRSQNDNDFQSNNRYQHASFKGQLFSASNLKWRDPDFVPQINQNGAIDRFILNLMAENLSIDKIADHLATAFPDYFPRLEEPLTRVRNVVEQYGET